MTQEHVPVLIVGAGGAGLSLSLQLLQQGIHPLLIERRADISVYPRARNLNFRTLEVFRGLHLADEVRAAGTSTSQSRVIFKESLASQQEQVQDLTEGLFQHLETISPDPFGWYCPQSRLEPLMLTVARERGADVRYSTELVSFEQDNDFVYATLKERSTARTYTVRTNYLAACDGAHSPIRQKLGIPTTGIGDLPEYYIFVYFHAPWQELIEGHEADAFAVKNTYVQGTFLVASEDLGMFLINYRPALGESLADFTAEHCHDLVEKAIGKPDMPIEIVDIAHWQPAESVAEQFQQGRIFLVGDAAHTMPAYKGLGVNTAIQSAQNLGWKLGAVLRGQASEELVRTYHAERHPVGQFAAHQSLTGPSAKLLPDGVKSKQLTEEKDYPLFYPIVGYRYRSQAILSEDAASAEQEIALLDRQELTGLPGTRVPHLWLEQIGKRISTLDLLDGRFILLTGEGGIAWGEAAATVKTRLKIDLAAYRIGPDADLLDLENEWAARMGVSSEGAVLIRPDGFVAWRTSTLTATPEQVLEQVLVRILCRSTDQFARK
jgi:putative polyketide hydroxylase